MTLAEPASSLTDLVLGLTALACALHVRGRPGVSRHWTRTFAWTGAAGIAGALHHGLLPLDSDLRGPSWAGVSGLVVVAISYMLAATVEDVLGPGHGRAFWVLRSASLLVYAAVALLGHASVGAILACESVTMLAVLVLWGLAAVRRHPRAGPVIAAIAAMGGAAGLQAAPGNLGPLDPVSLYHLGQAVGLVVLYVAVRTPSNGPPTRDPAATAAGVSALERAA